MKAFQSIKAQKRPCRQTLLERYARIEKALIEVTRPFPVRQSHGARLKELYRIAVEALECDNY